MWLTSGQTAETVTHFSPERASVKLTVAQERKQLLLKYRTRYQWAFDANSSDLQLEQHKWLVAVLNFLLSLCMLSPI